MSKFVKYVMLVFGLLIIAAIAFPMVAYQLEQPHQRKIQTEILRGQFAKVPRQNDKVLFSPDSFMQTAIFSRSQCFFQLGHSSRQLMRTGEPRTQLKELSLMVLLFTLRQAEALRLKSGVRAAPSNWRGSDQHQPYQAARLEN